MQPLNTNTLQTNKFQLNFTRTPNVVYFCQTVALPGISIGEAIRPTPFIDLYHPGDKIIYDYLTVTFLLDEDFGAWDDIHIWIRGLGFPESFEEYIKLATNNRAFKTPFDTVNRTQPAPQVSDAILTVLNSNQNPIRRFKFFDCFPTSLSPIILSATESPETTPTADVTFRFSYFNVDKIS